VRRGDTGGKEQSENHGEAGGVQSSGFILGFLQEDRCTGDWQASHDSDQLTKGLMN